MADEEIDLAEENAHLRAELVANAQSHTAPLIPHRQPVWRQPAPKVPLLQPQQATPAGLPQRTQAVFIPLGFWQVS